MTVKGHRAPSKGHRTSSRARLGSAKDLSVWGPSRTVERPRRAVEVPRRTVSGRRGSLRGMGHMRPVRGRRGPARSILWGASDRRGAEEKRRGPRKTVGGAWGRLESVSGLSMAVEGRRGSLWDCPSRGCTGPSSDRIESSSDRRGPSPVPVGPGVGPSRDRLGSVQDRRVPSKTVEGPSRTFR